MIDVCSYLVLHCWTGSLAQEPPPHRTAVYASAEQTEQWKYSSYTHTATAGLFVGPYSCDGVVLLVQYVAVFEYHWESVCCTTTQSSISKKIEQLVQMENTSRMFKALGMRTLYILYWICVQLYKVHYDRYKNTGIIEPLNLQSCSLSTRMRTHH